MLEFIFGPNIPKADQYLNHISKKPHGSSPVDYGMLSKSYLVKRSPASNFLRCALEGIFDYAALLAIGVGGYLALNEKAVNSITLNDKEDVCMSCAQSAIKVSGYVIQSCRILQKSNLPKPEVCETYIDNLSTGYNFLDNGLDWAVSNGAGFLMERKCFQFIYHNDPESKQGFEKGLENCREAHFMAATFEGAEILAIPVAVCAVLLSLYSFASKEASRSSIETQIISKLKERYQMAADKLAFEFDEAKGNVLLEGEVREKAALIIKNKVDMLNDIERLELPSLLIHENKLAIINPVLDVCKIILQK